MNVGEEEGLFVLLYFFSDLISTPLSLYPRLNRSSVSHAYRKCRLTGSGSQARKHGWYMSSYLIA